ncbi:hypothetical protein [Metallosphaera javensis (ex Sakai et al. 2022)]|uniref:hypothetical protein n=1 Tax=Metallosphaera javensis (ex Sakai et al. 2022) TaxID=2775498 RepID=UPI0025852032
MNSLAENGNMVVLVGGGNNYNNARLGILNLSNDTFYDLSSMLPTYYGPLNSVTYGGNVFVVGGSGTSSNPTSNFGILYSNLTFRDMSSEILQSGNFGWMNTIASNGSTFLLAGASSLFTPLDFYYPSNNQFTNLGSNIGYYFATNSALWDNYTKTYFIAGAGAGSFPNTNAKFGSITNGGQFVDYSYAVNSLNVIWRIGYAGPYIIICGQTSSGNYIYLFNTRTNTSINITKEFPPQLSVGSFYGHGQEILISGELPGNIPFLAEYYPGNQTLIPFNQTLLDNFTRVNDAIINNMGEVIAAGTDNNVGVLEIFSTNSSHPVTPISSVSSGTGTAIIPSVQGAVGSNYVLLELANLVVMIMYLIIAVVRRR